MIGQLVAIEKFAKWFYLGLAILLVIFATSAAAGKIKDGWQAAGGFFLLAAGCSFVVAIAAAAVGCLLGFLFGIPRSLQRGPQVVLIQSSQRGTLESQTQSGGQTQLQAGHEPSATTAHEAGDRGEAPLLTNTSLEEISDWLTKIIIGLSLVQFQSFITKLEDAAEAVAENIQAKESFPFFLALLITCLISAGFLTYLETRTRLTLLFVGALQLGKERSTD